MVREETDKKTKQTTSRPDTLWPEICKDMSDASKRKEKQVGYGETRKLVVCTSLILMIENSKIS